MEKEIMTHVKLNWKCDNCGHNCNSHICPICGRELKFMRKNLLKGGFNG